jgi:NAD(P)-dependent dehydrogenase (short-subunit alcohol dehydrogenase family)
MKGQVVLITGASGGLGTSVVRAFRDAGATVAASSRKSPDFPADLLDPAQAKALADMVSGRFGRIDALVHLAGGFVGGAVHETDDATWDQMMNVNLRSAFHMFRAVLPHMRAAGRGRIVAIGSRAAVDLPPGIAAYAASKAALVSLVRSISLENKQLGITANAILPSTIGAQVSPETIASLALYLVSDAAAQITGVAIPC